MTFPSYLAIQQGYQPDNDGKSCLKSLVPLQSNGKWWSKQQAEDWVLHLLHS